MSGDDPAASRPRAEGRALHDAAAEVPDAKEIAPPTTLPAVTPEELSKLPVFADLPVDARAWFARHATHRRYAPGARVFEATEPARNMFVVLDGVLQLYFELGGQHLLVSTHTQGSVTGMLPFSRMTHYNVRGVAAGALRLVSMDRDRFPELLRLSPEIGQRLVALMSDRVRDATQMQQQREKMTALGKLSAGLAHELNNPAAAVRRAASALRDRLDALPTLTSRLAAHGFGAGAVCAADALRAAAREGRGRSLRALERSEREDSVGEWLEAHGVEEPWRHAPVLVDAGVAPAQLDSLSDGIPAEALGDLLAWFEASLEADRLADEIGDAATRISELVASVKTYSHMDRATDVQPVHVEAGLDATLTLLAHKVRKKSVRLEREGAPLPEIQALPGELNQVWTNLLDNALDAVPEGGTIRLETGVDDGAVWVRIVDDGPGIPADIQTRIFEPFFTTKGVGQGTGLGLDIVRRIVELHQGQLSLDSRPGRTAFTVRLPIAART